MKKTRALGIRRRIRLRERKNPVKGAGRRQHLQKQLGKK
jgi:hypothetical protein